MEAPRWSDSEYAAWQMSAHMTRNFCYRPTPIREHRINTLHHQTVPSCLKDYCINKSCSPISSVSQMYAPCMKNGQQTNLEPLWYISERSPSDVGRFGYDNSARNQNQGLTSNYTKEVAATCELFEPGEHRSTDQRYCQQWPSRAYSAVSAVRADDKDRSQAVAASASGQRSASNPGSSSCCSNLSTTTPSLLAEADSDVPLAGPSQRQGLGLYSNSNRSIGCGDQRIFRDHTTTGHCNSSNKEFSRLTISKAIPEYTLPQAHVPGRSLPLPLLSSDSNNNDFKSNFGKTPNFARNCSSELQELKNRFGFCEQASEVCDTPVETHQFHYNRTLVSDDVRNCSNANYAYRSTTPTTTELAYNTSLELNPRLRCLPSLYPRATIIPSLDEAYPSMSRSSKRTKGIKSCTVDSWPVSSSVPTRRRLQDVVRNTASIETSESGKLHNTFSHQPNQAPTQTDEIIKPSPRTWTEQTQACSGCRPTANQNKDWNQNVVNSCKPPSLPPRTAGKKLPPTLQLHRPSLTSSSDRQSSTMDHYASSLSIDLRAERLPPGPRLECSLDNQPPMLGLGNKKSVLYQSFNVKHFSFLKSGAFKTMAESLQRHKSHLRLNLKENRESSDRCSSRFSSINPLEDSSSRPSLAGSKMKLNTPGGENGGSGVLNTPRNRAPIAIGGGAGGSCCFGGAHQYFCTTARPAAHADSPLSPCYDYATLNQQEKKQLRQIVMVGNGSANVNGGLHHHSNVSSMRSGCVTPTVECSSSNGGIGGVWLSNASQRRRQRTASISTAASTEKDACESPTTSPTAGGLNSGLRLWRRTKSADRSGGRYSSCSCSGCGFDVVAGTDKLVAEQQTYHRSCFKCAK